jgi:hypothetical protein
MRGRKKEREVTDRYTINKKRTAVSVRARKISTINLLYRKKEFFTYLYCKLKAKEKKMGRTNEQTILKVYVVSSSSSSSNEVEYKERVYVYVCDDNVSFLYNFIFLFGCSRYKKKKLE